MADVISGGVSTLPGAKWKLPPGTMCDDHPDRPAVARIQGETDSMGCELNDLCQECADAVRKYNETPRDGYCEVHKGEGKNLKPRRDSEEGMCGRLYDTCEDCRRKESERLNAELAELDKERGDYIDWNEWE